MAQSDRASTKRNSLKSPFICKNLEAQVNTETPSSAAINRMFFFREWRVALGIRAHISKQLRLYASCLASLLAASVPCSSTVHAADLCEAIGAHGLYDFIQTGSTRQAIMSMRAAVCSERSLENADSGSLTGMVNVFAIGLSGSSESIEREKLCTVDEQEYNEFVSRYSASQFISPQAVKLIDACMPSTAKTRVHVQKGGSFIIRTVFAKLPGGRDSVMIRYTLIDGTCDRPRIGIEKTAENCEVADKKTFTARHIEVNIPAGGECFLQCKIDSGDEDNPINYAELEISGDVPQITPMKIYRIKEKGTCEQLRTLDLKHAIVSLCEQIDCLKEFDHTCPSSTIKSWDGPNGFPPIGEDHEFWKKVIAELPLGTCYRIENIELGGGKGNKYFAITPIAPGRRQVLGHEEYSGFMCTPFLKRDGSSVSRGK